MSQSPDDAERTTAPEPTLDDEEKALPAAVSNGGAVLAAEEVQLGSAAEEPGERTVASKVESEALAATDGVAAVQTAEAVTEPAAESVPGPAAAATEPGTEGVPEPADGIPGETAAPPAGKQEAAASGQEAAASGQEAQASKQEAQAGKQEAQASKQEAQASKQEAQASKQEVQAGKQEAQASKQEVQAGKQEAQASKQEAQAGKQEAQAGKQEAQAGKQEAAASGQEAAASGQEAAASGQEAATGEKSPRRKALEPVLAAFADKTPLTGRVIGWNRGGFHVALDDVPAFCPKSQIEIGNPRKSASYVNREFDFRVIEVRDDGKRIVVSRAEALKQERSRLRRETKEKLAVGAELEGRVSSITDFGAFVDLGGLEGLVHLSQLSRKRVEHPRELLKVGDRVRVRVIKLEKGGSRISLSMRELEPDPWDGAGERHPSGSPFTGTVLRSTDFGIFVEIAPGLEGLVHSSQLPLGVELGDPTLEAGESVSGWVRDCDPARRRLSLAMREVATDDPWVDLSRRYPEGEEVEGTIEQVAKFGLFVQLEPGLTGLLPFSAMSMPEGSRPQRSFAPGQTILVQIDSIDERRRRISLAPKGRRLEGTRADFRDYIRGQKKPGKGAGLNAMAAAFEKLKTDEATS